MHRIATYDAVEQHERHDRRKRVRLHGVAILNNNANVSMRSVGCSHAYLDCGHENGVISLLFSHALVTSNAHAQPTHFEQQSRDRPQSCEQIARRCCVLTRTVIARTREQHGMSRRYLSASETCAKLSCRVEQRHIVAANKILMRARSQVTAHTSHTQQAHLCHRDDGVRQRLLAVVIVSLLSHVT
jgi:hypothetical protein